LKNIKTLIPDIYDLFNSGHKFDEKNVREFSEALTRKMLAKLSE
jgi:hypothetical protein